MALVRTKIDMFCQAVRTTNAHARERECAHVITAQNLDARLAHGVAIMRYAFAHVRVWNKNLWQTKSGEWQNKIDCAWPNFYI